MDFKTIIILLLLFALAFLFYLYFTKPLITLKYVPKYLAIKLNANSTNCFPKKIFSLEHPMSEEENFIVIEGNKSDIIHYFEDDKICIKNLKNISITVLLVSAEFENVFNKDCVLWYSYQVDKYQSFFICVQYKNQTSLPELCKKACQDEKCFYACTYAWEKFLKN